MKSVSDGWCLVLVIWGDKYSEKYVNVLVSDVKKNSLTCEAVILVTDRIRSGISDQIDQKLIPDFFNRPAFFKGGYAVKLSLFHKSVLPKNMRCVYVDLDTVVTGDLGRVAALVHSAESYFMLPPGSLIGFGALRRWIYKWSGGKMFGTGNSSVVAFHSAAEPNVCDIFEKIYSDGDTESRKMKIDDVFISWFAQPKLRPIPSYLVVMFRREFLTRSRFNLELRRLSQWREQRRKNLVAVTFNGSEYKPEALIALHEGDRITDSKKRFGIWSTAYLGGFKEKILQWVQNVR